MSQSTYSYRADPELKAQFDEVCKALGTTPGNAITMFMAKTIDQNGLPFQVTQTKQPTINAGDTEEPTDTESPADAPENLGNPIVTPTRPSYPSPANRRGRFPGRLPEHTHRDIIF